jgi:hypothetical protein
MTSAAKAAFQLYSDRSAEALRPQCQLSLALFVFRVDADHSHHSLAVDDLALVTNFLY